MKLKSLLCASALAVASFGALAEDFNQTVTFVPNASLPGTASAAWGVTHVEAGAFTDTFTFTGVTGATLFESSLVTIGFLEAMDIDFTSVTINGQTFDLNAMGAVELATYDLGSVEGPLTMVVAGIAGPALEAGSAISASYAGTANVSPIPEPETAAMMLAGLAVLGSLARRRLPR